jgi:hypothetical protein
MLPSAALHELGEVTVPAVMVGVGGLLSVLLVEIVPVQPAFVIEKLLYVPAFNPSKSKASLATVTLCGLFVAPVLLVKLNEYVPLGKLLVVNSMIPSDPAQVVGSVFVPTVKVGVAGLVSVLVAMTEPVQPERVTEKAE